MPEPERAIKIAVFLDVDKTITERTIQEVYAEALGQSEAYKKIEDDFQNKRITSKVFGDRLIQLFANQNFTKAKALELFDRVDLRDGIDKLLNLQTDGVDIYLVSSGPDYYVENFRRSNEWKEIPEDRVLSSRYIFGDDGVISRCLAVDDQDKVKFVLDRIDGYDLTIGIGDNDRHDKFVDVCTIPMFMEPHENYLHLPHFNALCTLIGSMRKTPKLEQKLHSTDTPVGLKELQEVTIATAWNRFSVGLWAAIGGAIIAAFFAGASADWFKTFVGLPKAILAPASAPEKKSGSFPANAIVCIGPGWSIRGLIS